MRTKPLRAMSVEELQDEARRCAEAAQEATEIFSDPATPPGQQRRALSKARYYWRRHYAARRELLRREKGTQ